MKTCTAEQGLLAKRKENRRRHKNGPSATEKKCTKCKKVKPASQFPLNRSSNTGLANRCKACKNYEQVAAYRAGSYLKHRYGITKEQYDRMHEDQGGRCAICNKHQEEIPTKLCVDHNHETKQVRGLLCRPCNSALGLLQDDQELVRRALRYLEKHEPGQRTEAA